jgi:hypothetical protein
MNRENIDVLENKTKGNYTYTHKRASTPTIAFNISILEFI